MDKKGTQLAQSRPGNTSAVSIYSPDEGDVTQIIEIVVCNVSSAAAKFRIFINEDGSTYDEDSAVYGWDSPIGAGEFAVIETNAWMRNAAGNLAVRTDTASALNFTVNGIIDSE